MQEIESRWNEIKQSVRHERELSDVAYNTWIAPLKFFKVENDVVVDACFNGVACTIATASTDILCELIIDKTKEEANYILDQYENMIFEKEFDEEVLDEALVFINTSKQAARIKCATIGRNGMKELIK